MREIKFRAWNKEHGEMVYSTNNFLYEKREFYPFCFEVGFSHYPEENWEIMQFTGLLDKNGKEIYEGDIVKYEALTRFHDDCDHEREVVKYDEKKSGFSPMIWQKVVEDGFYNYEIENLEIIGNIHQTPELIRGAK